MSYCSTTTSAILGHATTHEHRQLKLSQPPQLVKASIVPPQNDVATTNRRKLMTTLLLSTSIGVTTLSDAPHARAQSWGTRSFILEHFFMPGLSPEDSAERIKQTAEGLHSIRDMLEHKSWRYILFYIRLKEAYLAQDLKTVVSILPGARKKDYLKAANELVDNMQELDYYVRTPKIYESYLYYEKTLKSIDDVVALLA
ncbi:hypothetical protein ACFE04_022790 [Oxalis oulophora]